MSSVFSLWIYFFLKQLSNLVHLDFSFLVIAFLKVSNVIFESSDWVFKVIVVTNLLTTYYVFTLSYIHFYTFFFLKILKLFL